MKLPVAASIALLFMAAALANSTRDQPLAAQAELDEFTLPADFTIALVASEEGGLVKPIDLTFDDAGRLWTQTASMYPLDTMLEPAPDDPARIKTMEMAEAYKDHPRVKYLGDLYQGRIRGQDRILIVPDPHLPKPSKPIVWADGLAIPQSILPYGNGALVAQGSELFLLEDSDADGRSDKRTPLLTGFGFTDTHTMAHSLVRGPGGWVHFSHGGLNKGEVTSLVSGQKIRVDYSKILRMSLDGARLDAVASGLNNIWGFQLRADGQWYGTEANDRGWSVVPMEEGTGFLGIGNERLRPYQPWMPELHAFRVGGTGISGLAFAEDAAGSFPEEWRDVALLANPITSSINAVRIVRNSDGTVSAQHLPDLLTTRDNWFRPVNLEFGPDGCLYVADWYNKIISHNEVPLDHPGRDKSRGRIWRICHRSHKPRPIPDLYRASTEALLTHLQAPSLWEKRAAWHQIVDRQAAALGPRLVKLAADASLTAITRIHALWSLEGLGHFDQPLIAKLLQSPADELRREATRALAGFARRSALTPQALARHAHVVKDDKNVMVRSQLLRTLMDAGMADASIIDLLVGFCRPDSDGNALGGAYERKFERYLARRALEQHPAALSRYLVTPAAQRHPASHLFWASQALAPAERAVQFPALWPGIDKQPLEAPNFVAVAELLGDPRIVQAVKPFFDDPRNAGAIAELARESYTVTQSAQMAALLQPAVLHLLRSADLAQIRSGLNVAAKFEVPGIREAVVAALQSPRADEATMKLALTALDRHPQENKALLTEFLERPELSFGMQLRALSSLLNADPGAAQRKLESWLKTFTGSQRRALTEPFSTFPAGRPLLLQLVDKRLLNPQDFEIHTAHRIGQWMPYDERASSLRETVERHEQARQLALKTKMNRLAQLAAKQRGNPQTGGAIFNGLCLSCHTVSGKGVGFAPALDGSAHRDITALLTSIYDPDAAVESSYSIYIVVKNDGSLIEGYRKSKDGRGVTMQFMGGGELFIDESDIQYAYFDTARSVMPRGLMEGLSDEQVEDVLAYIRTLK